MNRYLPALTQFALTLTLLSAAALARAGECQIAIEADDNMQFNQRQLTVPSSCATVELTLKHVGSYARTVMGHNWVLAKTSDVNAVINGGMSAGLSRDYQSAGDPRIIASTKVVGGGESATISFSTEKLQPGSNYTFFCTYPGHSTMMKGAFVYGERGGERVARAGN